MVLATAVHGLVLVTLDALPKARQHIDRPAGPQAGELAIDLEVPSVAAVAIASSSPEVPPLWARGSSPHTVDVAPPNAGGAAATEPAGLPTPSPQAAAPQTAMDALPPGFRSSPIDLLARSPESPSFLMTRGILTPADREGPGGGKEAERTIRSQLRDRDVGLGLGASGPVVAEVEEIARTGTSSIESHAILDVVANGEGEIVSVTVADASEDRPGWQTAANALLARLRAKHVRVRVPRTSRGLAMTIAVDSREALPSGAAPGVNVHLFDQKVASGKNERATSVTILPLAKLGVKLPTGETATLVLPVPVPIVAGRFDVADIGARASRIVHARTTHEQEL